MADWKDRFLLKNANPTPDIDVVELWSYNSATGEVERIVPRNLLPLYALLASPTFTGTPAAPTAAPGTNTTQLATTAFVAAALATLIGTAPGILDTLGEISDAINDDANLYTTLVAALALKAPLASPALTGMPTAPTASPGDNSTQIATTAYVDDAVSGGGGGTTDLGKVYAAASGLALP